MANNYCESSSWMDIPPDKADLAAAVIQKVAEQLENDPEYGYFGIEASVEKESAGCGVWITGGESFDAEHAEVLARALVDELEIDGPFFCSWAHTCSKKRIDEFGGGAFVVVRGKPSYWCDAMTHVQRHYENYMKDTSND